VKIFRHRLITGIVCNTQWKAAHLSYDVIKNKLSLATKYVGRL
jgi:hypothetical protein